MFSYEKRLEYPIHIKETNPKLAKAIISQYGGPDGELGASMRYLSQRYTMPYKECMGNTYGYRHRRAGALRNDRHHRPPVDP